jgi:Carboxypeptidase regulatory-like domain
MSGSVYGNVVRAETGEPVAGATVVCGRIGAFDSARPPSAMSALTDGAGWFRFENLPAGEWLLKTHGAGGYSPPQTKVSVFDNALSETTLEVVSTPRPDVANRPVSSGGPRGNVRGRVVDTASGEPIGYATVIVVSGPGAVREHVFVASSAGWFELDEVPVGDWLLRARSDAGATGIATVRVVANALSQMTIAVNGWRDIDQPTSSIEPIFATGGHAMVGRLVGHVIYADDGRPVADATVTILRGAGPAPDIAPMTDRNGSFALDGLPAGSWLLRAVGPGGETGLVQVSVRPGGITDALIKLTRNTGNHNDSQLPE